MSPPSRKPAPPSSRSRQAEPSSVEPALPAAGGSVQWLIVDPELAGQRLDNFLMAQLRGVPRSKIYRIVRKGEVRVNRGRVRPDTRLKAGDEVRIPPVIRPVKAPVAVPGSRVQGVMEGAIIFENPELLVVNKPAGIAVHGGSGLSFGLIEVLRAARPEARFLELVHRLDRDTSGLVMVAKKRSALKFLQEELRGHRINKRYHALVSGQWDAGVKEVNVPLLRYEMPNGERRVKVDDTGKSSLTRYRLLQSWQGYSLVEASPVTGRTHQIRVHCGWAGHPIAGDDKYMDEASLRAFRKVNGDRLMLHARALSLTLPGTEPGKGEQLTLEAPYDEAFSRILASLGRPV